MALKWCKKEGKACKNFVKIRLSTAKWRPGHLAPEHFKLALLAQAA
jgi:hypothetical protein